MNRWIVSGCLFLVLIFSSPLHAAGVLDLAGWQPEERPVMLTGQWQAAFNRLLLPDDPAWATVVDTFSLPGLWQPHLGQAATGVATFRMTLTHLPMNLTQAALYIPDIFSVGKVWINGQPMARTGQVGTDKASEKPRTHALLFCFSPEGSTLDIVIQMSNFHNARGGINQPVWFGSADAVQDLVSRKRIVATLISAAFFMISLFHLALFVLGRTDPAHVWFGLYALTWAIQTFFTPSQGSPGTFVFNRMPWHLPIDLTLSACAAGPALLIMCYHALFPLPWGKWVNRVFQAAALAFFIYILLPPANAFDPVCLVYFFFTLAGFVYLFIRLILDLKNRQPGTGVLLPGFLILIFTIINDILGDTHLIRNPSVSVGLFAFILSYSAYISLRLSRTFAKVRDLSITLQQQNQELSKLDRLKDQFLANTSHELKTPLNGIMGLAQSLADQTLPSRVTKGMVMIEASARRLLSLINDLLDLSLLKNRDLSLALASVNLTPVVDAVLMVMAPLVENRSVALENRIPENFPALKCDEDRLHQILFNLVGNSIKFTESGTISIQASVQDHMARISVRDTGIGIDPEIQTRIFNAFEQGDGAPRGTGLGLTITRDLVRLNSGAMGVDSRPGNGSEFWFTLPLWHEGEPRAASQLSWPEPPFMAGFPESACLPAGDDRKAEAEDSPLILVVDDDRINLEVVVNHLSGEGLAVETAGNGEQALNRLACQPLPDLVLLDLMMPGVNGYEVCNRIRKAHCATELPVIMLTARHGVADLVKGLTLGANDYLTKPFEKEELKARVKTQLHLKQAFQAIKENEALKAELAKQRKRESTLKMAQRKLSDMLDSIKDAVLVVNPGGETAFANSACASLLNQSPEALLGKPVVALFDKASAPILESLAKGLHAPSSSLKGVVLKGAEDEAVTVDITLGPMPLNDEDFCFLILKDPHAQNSPSADRVIAFLNTMSLNQERLSRLELILQGVTAEVWEEGAGIHSSINAIDRIIRELAPDPQEKAADRKALLVRVMNLSLDLWAAGTQTNRVELAEQSGLWNVYIGKDGWARTQTLDKYLDTASLPKRPKWKTVINTADFVLAACSDTDSAMRKDLEDTLKGLRHRV